jgi:Ca2+-binding EF-hand superfamily protein
MELAMNSSDEGRSSDSEAEDKQPAPEPVKPRRVQQVILPPGGNSSDAGGGEEPEREARKPRPMELAMNSSDQGSSSDSEGQAEQPAPEPVKPRVKRRAVPDHLDSGLVSPTGLPLVVNSSEQRPKTAEQLADAEELAERQRGRSGRRGSVVQFAGRRAAMSVEAELEATLTRLRRARDSNDANEMQSALIAAAPAAMMSGPLASEVQSIAMAIAARLASDEDLVRAGTLRKSGRIRGKVRRLWQLMVVETLLQASEDERTTESQRLIDVRHAQHDATTERAQGTEGDVSKAGYLMLHMRVAKVLIPPGAVNPDGIPVEFHTAEAREMAEADWDADVARFSGSSHIMGWIDTIRTKFKVASSRVVMEHGFSVLFEQLDTDGSGELDREEFASAVRTELGISERDISDTEVSNIFRAVDADQSGSICASEFVSWLCGDESEEAKRALAASPRSNPVREKLKLLAEERTQATGWSSIFDKYDFDHSGELELGEFTAAVRGECNLKESQMSDNDLEELFAVVDADESGAIDAAELCVLLTADLATPSMTFGPFHASLFELMTLWVPEETEEAYCNFLQQLFEAISMPVNGHTTDEDLSAVPVFDAIDGKTPNFRLRDLDACARLLDGNGALRNNAAGVCDNAAGVSVHTEDQPASPVVMTPRDRPDRGGRRQRALTRHISSTMMHSVDRGPPPSPLCHAPCQLLAFADGRTVPSFSPRCCRSCLLVTLYCCCCRALVQEPPRTPPDSVCSVTTPPEL